MGNEAIALGALHAGICLAAGYPGTPSTEILEAAARGDIHAQWSVNEKLRWKWQPVHRMPAPVR